MINPGSSIGSMLRLNRTFAAPREKVFQAWTQPEHLRNWWGMGAGYTAPIVEIDLRVGGRYRLGMQPPDDGDPSAIKIQLLERIVQMEDDLRELKDLVTGMDDE